MHNIISKEESRTLPKPQLDIGQTITWWNIIQLSKDYVKEQSQKTGNKQLVYIPHPAERYASSKYMDLGQTAEDAFTLLQKLICIKKSKMGESKYWKDCAINLMDCYSYQAKINNAYTHLKDHEKIPVKTRYASQESQDASDESQTLPETYQDFLDWIETDTRIEKDVKQYYKSLRVDKETEGVIIFADILPHRKKMVELFCKKLAVSKKVVLETE
jgi:hypothetical protein